MEKGQLLFAVAAMLVCVFITSCEGIQCYQCMSSKNSTCNDPFDVEAETSKAFKKDCQPDETYCRKVDQDVYGTYNTIRECGKTETEYRCRERAASKGVKMNYCSCNGEACNSTNQLKSTGVLLQVLASIILAAFLRNAL